MGVAQMDHYSVASACGVHAWMFVQSSEALSLVKQSHIPGHWVFLRDMAILGSSFTREEPGKPANPQS